MLKPGNGSSTRALDYTPTDYTRQQNFLAGNINLILNACDSHNKSLNEHGKSTNEKLLVKMDRDPKRRVLAYSVTLLMVEISLLLYDSTIFFHLSLLFNLLRLMRSEEDDMDTSWDQRLVKRYYGRPQHWQGEGRQAAVMCEATDDGHADVMASHWLDTCRSTLD
ncbi:hypothetical protein SADUNF_Sadunf09G0047300 [Salix dunnii]|uniref:Uncharacterized protein n=1 Tax=Salix dunnii TaxID=1413687 RepID=A0A835JWY4_9ROSI|nr:hypothetical protein SADUNF_Sadunf09G0047300 [Salix dunnii]